MLKQYRNPLITNAIIDLKVSLNADVNQSDLAGLAASLRERYPRQEAMYSQTFQAQFSALAGQPPSSEVTQQENGFRLSTSDNLNIAQITSDGFTLIRLKPYDGWASFSTEAKRIWRMYKDICQVKSINRAAVRYINRLDISSSEDAADYLRLQPQIPQDFPFGCIDSFFVQMQIPQKDLECNLVINQARIADLGPETRSYVLDFDLFREHPWDVSREDEIWNFLESLRTRKNEIFEASITPKTRRLMESLE